MEKSCFLLVLVATSLFVAGAYGASYSVVAKRLSNEPVITSQTHGASVFTYNYNPAFLPLWVNGHYRSALMVRCQNKTASGIGPSELSLTVNGLVPPHFAFTAITNSSIKFHSQMPWEDYGTEDPRIVYNPQNSMYYMLYSAVETKKNPHGNLICRLALATTKTPQHASSWVRHGPIFPDKDGFQWSKSGATIVRDHPPHYLIYGDSSYLPGIQLATSPNLLNYSTLPGIFIHTRSNSFDSSLVESGPPPLTLADGNYLFVYNSAKPHPGVPNKLQYNAGWVILDGKDPSRILQRSDEPLLSPELPWEIGTAPYLGLTPQVVFVEGMERFPGQDHNRFVIYYGAADSVVGVAEVNVQIHH